MKSYKLTIPRPQYDRIADAFDTQVIDFEKFDSKADTITFNVTERQRLAFSKHARKNINHLYYITQMFLPRNIGAYEV
tara:strand:- start:268 stop:501 length:234 start_codon:yes stop_codon:yes gene_type:complete